MKQDTKLYLKAVEKGRQLVPPYQSGLTGFDVFTTDWAHVCRALFGPARPCSFSSTTKWTGDSYQYDIFKARDFVNHPRWALRWWNGGGEGWLLCDDLDRRAEKCLLETIAAIKSETRRWDACHFIWQVSTKTATEAAHEEAAKYRKAFVEGRLKKKKRRGGGGYQVSIVPERT